MDRPDGPGVAVVGHACHLGQAGLVQARVGDHHPQGGVARGQAGGQLHVPEQLLQGGRQAGPVFVEQAGQLDSVRAVDVPQGVYRHQGAHLQCPGLEGAGPEAGLHGPAHPPVLAHGAAGASPYAALGGRVIAGVFTSGVGHLLIGADVLPAHAQVKETGLAHQGDLGHPGVKADVPLLQILLHPAGGVQAESAAPRQKDGVDALGVHQGVQDLGLPGGGAAPPHIQPGGGHAVAEDYRAAGGGGEVLGVAHPEAAHLHDSNFLHAIERTSFLCMVFSSALHTAVPNTRLETASARPLTATRPIIKINRLAPLLPA